MNEYRTQRNVLLTILVVIGAVALGFVLGRSRPATDAPRPGTAHSQPTEPAVVPSPGPAEDSTDSPAPAAPSPAAPPTASRPDPAPTPAAKPAPVVAEPPARQAAAEEEAPRDVESAPAPDPRPEPRNLRLEVPAGTQVELELTSGLSSQTAVVGDPVSAEVAQTIRVDGEAVIPAGTRVEGRVVEVHPLAKIGGHATLSVTFDRLLLANEDAPITASWRREGKSETGKDAATIAAGAAVGTIAGNQAKKNDKGKAIGALIGAGLGTLIASKTPGDTVELPAGSHLTLTLRDPVEVTIRN
ncbi:MAG: glycine zipper 2TM domain-containing protein [Thermoanaerobaculia bacterium]